MRGKTLYASAKRWGCRDEERVGMLLFVQRVRELLIHTTSIPAKPFSVSALTLAREIYSILRQHSETPHPSAEANVKQLVVELEDALGKDGIAKAAVGDRWSYSKQILSNFSDTHNQLECARYILDRFSIKQYISACSAKVVELIENGGREKRELIALSEAFVGAVREAGYPTQTIYHLLNVSFFDHERTPMSASDRLMQFFSNFDLVPHTYEVYFALTDIAANVADKFSSVGGTYAESNGEMYDQLVEEMTARNRSFFLKTAPQGIVVFRDVKALDPQSARVHAERRLRLLDDLLRFSVHGGRFIIRNQGLVRKEKGNQFVNSNRPKAPIMLVPHDSDTEHTGLANLAAALRRIRGGSAERFIRAIELHGTALSAQEDESQLLNIWIALETLFVTGRSGSKVKEIIDAITPYVVASWSHYVFGELWERIEHIHAKAWAEAVKGADALVNLQGMNQLVLALADVSFKKEVTNFLATLDDDPLFRCKLCACIGWVQTAQKIREYQALLQQKVVADINRIYRSRNQIVHTGGAHLAAGDVVQLAHFYLDLSLAMLSLLFGAENGVKSIDQANLETKIRFKAFLSYLEESASNGVTCDAGNYSRLIFGRALLQ